MNPLQDKDILWLIFNYLDANSLCNAAKTCRKWNFVYNKNKFQYTFYGKKFVNEKLYLVENIDVRKDVKICSPYITDVGIINLYKNNKIRKLSIQYNSKNITDKSIKILSETLEALNCTHSVNLTDTSLRCLAKSKKIKYLSVSYDEISDNAFIGLNFVEHLFVEGKNLSNGFVEYVASDNLKEIGLPSQITSFFPLHFCKLTYLSLYGSEIADEELTYIKTDNLKTLILCWCKNISDVGIFNLTKGKELHLEKLCLRSTKISNTSLMNLSATDLDIWGTNITDDGFIYLNKTLKLSIGEMKNLPRVVYNTYLISLIS